MATIDVLKKFFPFLAAGASIAGGPIGGMAASLVGKALGMDKAPDPASLTDVLSQAMLNPDQVVALKKAEQDFQLQMQEAGFKDAETMAQIAAGDRDSARKREMTVRDKIPAALAIFVTMGFFSILGLMFFHALPNDGHDALMVMLGALGTAWLSIIAYYFGSSAGSDRKTELLAQAPAIK